MKVTRSHSFRHVHTRAVRVAVLYKPNCHQFSGRLGSELAQHRWYLHTEDPVKSRIFAYLLRSLGECRGETFHPPSRPSSAGALQIDAKENAASDVVPAQIRKTRGSSFNRREALACERDCYLVKHRACIAKVFRLHRCTFPVYNFVPVGFLDAPGRFPRPPSNFPSNYGAAALPFRSVRCNWYPQASCPFTCLGIRGILNKNV